MFFFVYVYTHKYTYMYIYIYIHIHIAAHIRDYIQYNSNTAVISVCRWSCGGACVAPFSGPPSPR